MPAARRNIQAWLVTAAFALCALPQPAMALFGDTDEALGIDASYRMLILGGYSHIRDFDSQSQNLKDRAALIDPFLAAQAPSKSDLVFGQNQNLLRWIIAGRPSGSWKYELHLLNAFTLASQPMPQADELATYRSYRLQAHYPESGRARGSVAIDRLNIKARLGEFDVTLGRQALSFGKAQFWNPLDVFKTFSATEFDREFKEGVDVVRVDYALGDFSGLTLVAGGGDIKAAWDGDTEDFADGSALLLRLFTNIADWDVAIQGGKVSGGYHVGAGTSGDFGIIEARLEAGYFYPERMGNDAKAESLKVPDFFTLAAGMGRMFENGVMVTAEYYYNGGGRLSRDKAMALQQAGKILHQNEHLAGAFMTYQFHALVTGSIGAIGGLSDRSMLVQPGLHFSLADEVDLVAGAMVGIGKSPKVSGCPPVGDEEPSLETLPRLTQCTVALGAPETYTEFGGSYLGYIQMRAHF